MKRVLQKLLRTRAPAPRRPGQRRCLQIEGLEDRCTPTSLSVVAVNPQPLPPAPAPVVVVMLTYPQLYHPPNPCTEVNPQPLPPGGHRLSLDHPPDPCAPVLSPTLPLPPPRA